MAYLFLFIILFTITISFILKFDRRFEECFPLSIISIVLILFVFGIFFNLQVGFCFALVFFGASLIYNLINYKKMIANKSLIFTFGTLAIFIFYMIIIWSNYNRVISLWDEFSHWGLTVKNMFVFNELSTIESSTALFKDYPPATALFQYFFIRLFGYFNESAIYVAMYLMMFSFLAPIFKFIKKINFVNFINMLGILFLLILLPTLLYPYIYITLQVDGMVGIIFASMLLVYFLSDKCDLFVWLKLTFLGIVLVLTKQIGVYFVGIALLSIFIDYFLIKNKLSLNFIKSNYKKIIIPLFLILLTMILWKSNLFFNNVKPSWSNSIGIKDILDIFTNHAPPYRLQVIKNYVYGIFLNPLDCLSMHITLFGWCAIILSGIMLTIGGTKNKENVKIERSVYFSYWPLYLGFIFYIGILMLLYMFKFSEWEAVRLASFSRYVSTYIIGFLLYLFGVYVLKLSKFEKLFCKTNIIIVSLCILFINMSGLFELSILAKSSVNTTIERRKDYYEYENIVKKNVKKDDKVYFIATNSNGGEYFIGRYLATPIKVNPPVWSIGKPYSSEDIWTIDISASNWRKELQDNNYKYVYLYKVDSQFENIYSELFYNSNLSNNQLYLVNKNESGPILKLVEEGKK